MREKGQKKKLNFKSSGVTARDDGKIIEFREYWDTLYAFETMFEGKTEL